MSARPAWLLREVRGLLLDINGVLFDNTPTGPSAIEGSVAAVNRLKEAGFPLRFCTNETMCPGEVTAERLISLGFIVSPSEVFSPFPAAKQVLKEHKLNPYLLVHPDAVAEFQDFNKSQPDAVVMGDAAEQFTYENMNSAFRVLMNAKKPFLISMGYGFARGTWIQLDLYHEISEALKAHISGMETDISKRRYYKHGNELVLDVGAFAKALEFACNTKSIVVGKPSRDFFQAALKDMGITSENAVMIGDDIVNDVGAAQKCGLRGVQVRTGKYRAEDEPHPSVKPDAYVQNLAEAVDLILQYNGNQNTS